MARNPLLFRNAVHPKAQSGSDLVKNGLLRLSQRVIERMTEVIVFQENLMMGLKNS
jgi:hypothetical protein